MTVTSRLPGQCTAAPGRPVAPSFLSLCGMGALPRHFIVFHILLQRQESVRHAFTVAPGAVVPGPLLFSASPIEWPVPGSLSILSHVPET